MFNKDQPRRRGQIASLKAGRTGFTQTAIQAKGKPRPRVVKLDGVIPLGAVAVPGGSLGGRAVLVTFEFTNPKWIPAGIPEKDRPSNAELNAYRASIARLIGQEQLAVIGRVREGQVDNGKDVIVNAPMVQVATLRRGFANNKLYLVDVHWYRCPREKRSPKSPHEPEFKYNVRLTYAPLRLNGDEQPPPLPRSTVDALRALARTTWQICHGWVNPVPVDTIICIGRQPDARPKFAVVVRDRIVRLQAVAERLEEGDE